MNNIDFNQLRDRAYQCACDHGFHELKLSNEHFLMLVITELSEAVEADRKGRRAKIEEFKRREEHYAKSRYALKPKEFLSKAFEGSFEYHIKDTVEDELADAVIRLLDLAGVCCISIEPINESIIKDMEEACKDETFTESIYSISTMSARMENGYDLCIILNAMIISIFWLAKHLDIDLLFFIEQKMKYNELREDKHGKRY